MFELVFLIFTPDGREIEKPFMLFQSQLGCVQSVRHIERRTPPTRTNSVIAVCRNGQAKQVYAVEIKHQYQPPAQRFFHPQIINPVLRGTTGKEVRPRPQNPAPFDFDRIEDAAGNSPKP